MTEKETIKDLERQANNTRQLMDRLNKAAYGMTFEEALKLGNFPSDESEVNGNDNANQGTL